MEHPEGVGFLGRALADVVALGVPVCVVGDEPAIVDAAKQSGCEVISAEVTKASYNACFPQGCEGAMDALVAAGYAADICVVADLRNPELPELIQEALALLASEGCNLVLSGNVPRDHPCQLFSAYRLEDAGMVRISEGGWSMNR